MKYTSVASAVIAKVLIAASAGYLWHRGYHSCAISYIFFIFMNSSDSIQSSIKKEKL